MLAVEREDGLTVVDVLQPLPPTNRPNARVLMKRGRAAMNHGARQPRQPCRAVQQLLEEANVASAAGGGDAAKGKALSRKQQRKDQRKQKKESKQMHQMRGKDMNGGRRDAQPPASAPAPPPQARPPAPAAAVKKQSKRAKREREPTPLEIMLQERGFVKSKKG